MDQTNTEMNTDTFKAFMVKEKPRGIFNHSVEQVPFQFLPEYDVIIEVKFSSVNYKDALSASGNTGVTRKFPHIPGIDAAGYVICDGSGTFKKDQPVIVTGQDLGSNTPGGFGSMIRVPKEWVVELPDDLSLQEAMFLGTAGFTAMYGIKRLQRENIVPEGGPVLVTGATGSVGSLAVSFLSALGYEVVAATGKLDKAELLRDLGAKKVIHRDEITQVKDSLLLSRKWNACIETVGGKILDAVIRQINHDGVVACCGNILGDKVATNIYPFILRGVSLLGIDSAICKMPMRKEIWKTMAELKIPAFAEELTNVIGLEQLSKEMKLMLMGQHSGRTIVKHQ